MRRTLAEIAEYIDGDLVGDGNVEITGLSGIKEAGPGDLTFLANEKYFPLAQTTQASAIIIPPGFSLDKKAAIRTKNPSYAFAKILSREYDQAEPNFSGIHETAVIKEGVRFGKDVTVGPYVVIERDAVIGDGCRIGGGSYIGHGTTIGQECVFSPHVIIHERTVLHDRVVIHSGTVVGADGFGYVDVDGIHKKIPQVGIVEIESDVEIGANVTIDRARFDKTIIGEGTKIDNLVQIAHNTRIGKHCILISQVGISGSTVIGDRCVLAGQSGVTGHITLGEGSIVSAKTGVISSIPPKSKVFGFPARPHMEAKRLNIHLERLPEYLKQIKALENRVKELEEEINALKRSKHNG